MPSEPQCNWIRLMPLWLHTLVKPSQSTAPKKVELIGAEARRARGEADFQTRRAVNLDRDNHEVKKLRVEVAELIGSPFLNRGIAPARPRSDR